MKIIPKHAECAPKNTHCSMVVLVVHMFCTEQVDMQNRKNREKYVKFAAALSDYPHIVSNSPALGHAINLNQ